MVAFFTGLGSGLERGSGAHLGSQGLIGNAAFGRSGEKLLLNAATGNLLIAQQDEFLVGRGPDASVSRRARWRRRAAMRSGCGPERR